MPFAHRFLEPRVLAALKNLQLLAKTVVDGFMLGPHANPHPGAGLEFNQYRGYQPGDDPRFLDWKVFARSDRYYVREAEIETSIHVHFVLDASASMDHRDSNGVTKFDLARFAAASLGYLAFHQGDAIGLQALNDDQPVRLPCRHDHRHLHRFLERLASLQPTGAWPAWDTVETWLSGNRRRGLMVVLTDLFEYSGEIRQLLARWSAMGHEVLLFHISAGNEWSLPYSGPVTFEDLETGRRVKINPDAIRETYRARLKGAQTAWRAELHEARIAYEPLQTDQPLDFALRAFLTRRATLP